MLVTGDVAVNAYPLRTASSAAAISGGGSGSKASRYAVAPDIELRSGRAGHPSANCEIFDGTEIGPIRRKRQRWLAKIRGDAVAMARIDTDREAFARNDFTTIGNGIEAQSGDHR